jgi:hypothetical protein
MTHPASSSSLKIRVETTILEDALFWDEWKYQILRIQVYTYVQALEFLLVLVSGTHRVPLRARRVQPSDDRYSKIWGTIPYIQEEKKHRNNNEVVRLHRMRTSSILNLFQTSRSTSPPQHIRVQRASSTRSHGIRRRFGLGWRMTRWRGWFRFITRSFTRRCCTHNLQTNKMKSFQQAFLFASWLVAMMPPTTHSHELLQSR